jgi:hypothetical protein
MPAMLHGESSSAGTQVWRSRLRRKNDAIDDTFAFALLLRSTDVRPEVGRSDILNGILRHRHPDAIDHDLIVIPGVTNGGRAAIGEIAAARLGFLVDQPFVEILMPLIVSVTEMALLGLDRICEDREGKEQALEQEAHGGFSFNRFAIVLSRTTLRLVLVIQRKRELLVPVSYSRRITSNWHRAPHA